MDIYLPAKSFPFVHGRCVVVSSIVLLRFCEGNKVILQCIIRNKRQDEERGGNCKFNSNRPWKRFKFSISLALLVERRTRKMILQSENGSERKKCRKSDFSVESKSISRALNLIFLSNVRFKVSRFSCTFPAREISFYLGSDLTAHRSQLNWINFKHRSHRKQKPSQESNNTTLGRWSIMLAFNDSHRLVNWIRVAS